MRNKRILLVATLMTLLMTLLNESVSAQITLDSDERLAEEAAQRFVRRLQETRDVAPLIKEMFVAEYLDIFACDLDGVSPEFYSQLSQVEKRRLFEIQVNIAYLGAIDLIYKSNIKHTMSEDLVFSAVLPPVMAENLREFFFGSNATKQFSKYADFKERLPKIEKILSDANSFLKKNNIEQSEEFQKALGSKFTVKILNTNNFKILCREFICLLDNRKVYRIDTPLFFRLFVVKEADKMKIIALGRADDD